jgi:hypothetical protein
VRDGARRHQSTMAAVREQDGELLGQRTFARADFEELGYLSSVRDGEGGRDVARWGGP